MGNLHAIVVFYDGKTPTETDIDVLGAVLDERFGMTTDSQIMVYSEKELSNLILTGIPQVKELITPAKEVSNRTPEDYAVIYIGEILKPYLKDYNYEQFVPILTRKIVAAQQNMTEDDRKFLNALDVLSQHTLNISKSLLREYYLTPRIITVIKNTYLYTK